MRYLRNLGRRPVRTVLTILGITIGIWALVVFGSMANKINALVTGGSTYYADKITVSDASGQLGGFASAPMSLKTADQLRSVDGVNVVVPSVMMLMDDQASAVTMGVPPMITGSIAGADQGLETFKLSYTEGRAMTAADEGSNVVVLGSDIARKYDKHVGDTMILKGVAFNVIGVLEPTLTAPDQAASIPLAAAQKLLVTTLPPIVQSKLTPSDIATSMVVYPKAGQDIEALAIRLKVEVPSISTMTGKDFDKQIGGATSILNSILVGIALISLLVGGLSVVNTMAMSIAERTREIGIKRAIGGSRSRIVRELVIEAGLIGFIGGAVGLILGAIVVTRRQRGRPGVGHGPVRPHRRHGHHGGRLLHDPRCPGGLLPGPARRPARSGHGAPLPVTAMTAMTDFQGDRSMYLLTGRALRKTYKLGKHNEVKALRGVEIAIAAGEMVAIMGPSGSGKSTLMHILGLLHAPDVDDGPQPELTFDGRDVAALGDRERTRIRAREMGFVFQDFNLVPTLTASENVMLACDYAGTRGAEARTATLDALALVGLADRAGHRPSELSGGEQQRVAIARALVNKPRLVLADEPTGNLDSERSVEVLGLLRQFNQERGQTFILVTHDAEVGAACDRIVRMRDGMIREPAPVAPPVEPRMVERKTLVGAGAE